MARVVAHHVEPRYATSTSVLKWRYSQLNTRVGGSATGVAPSTTNGLSSGTYAIEDQGY